MRLKFLKELTIIKDKALGKRGADKGAIFGSFINLEDPGIYGTVKLIFSRCSTLSMH